MECPYKPQDDVDGRSQWEALQQNATHPRFSILHNIDPMKRVQGTDKRDWIHNLAKELNFDINSQSALRFGQWKILTGDPAHGVPDGNIEPPEWSQKLVFEPINKKNEEYWKRDLRDNFFESTEKLDRLVQLFDIKNDPYEHHDISDENIDLVRYGLSLLSLHNETSVTPQWPKIDPASNPNVRKGNLTGFWWPWK
jgi:hypothetical protein